MYHFMLALILSTLVVACGDRSTESASSETSWAKYQSTVSSFQTRAAETGASCGIEDALKAAGCPLPPKPDGGCLPPLPSQEEMQKTMACLNNGGGPRGCFFTPPKISESCKPPAPQKLPAQCWDVLADFADRCRPTN